MCSLKNEFEDMHFHAKCNIYKKWKHFTLNSLKFNIRVYCQILKSNRAGELTEKKIIKELILTFT